MEILSYGYKLPEDDDTYFWDYLRFTIQQLNDHSHNGTDSAAIGRIVERYNSGWSTYGGQYRKQIGLPNNLQFDNVRIFVREWSTKTQIHPTIIKNNDTSLFLYSPLSSNDWEVIYYA